MIHVCLLSVSCERYLNPLAAWKWGGQAKKQADKKMGVNSRPGKHTILNEENTGKGKEGPLCGFGELY